jgi:hypothetical protein
MVGRLADGSEVDIPAYGYYAPLLLASGGALVFLLLRTLRTRGDQGQRARLFAAGLVVGLGPIFAQIAIEAIWPAYFAFMSQGRRRALVTQLLFFPCLLSVPITTAYAVLVHRVFRVRHLARRAIQYALARYSAFALAVVPLIALAAYLYFSRAKPLDEIFSGGRLPLLAGAAGIGFAALRYRRTLLDAIDRQFFREQYDARRILTLLVERIRATRSTADLAHLVAREIDLALHLESVVLLAFDARSGQLADPRERGRRLDGSSALVTLIAAGSEPVPVDLGDARSPFARLPEAERYWLVDSGFRLVVPILARDGSLLGLLGLGEKKSGLPFLKEDRQLLRAIASNAAWVLELEQGRSPRSWQDTPTTSPGTAVALAAEEAPQPPVELAKECPHCGRVFQSFTVLCSSCSHRLEPAPVPFTLAGKFRFERRIGTGGMGVVYRASDLALGRAVAVKTLRRVSPEDAMRLRREARTAAAVSHVHLAAVYGMETWQGTPLLVMELLEGGTLSQRLAKGPLEPPAVVELGIAMAGALEHLHRADILHRDIKPSNIGFTREEVPKLMDFGIARAMFDMRKDLHLLASSDSESDFSLEPPTLAFPSSQSLSVSNQLVGTLGYLSPEAIDGRSADVSFDLWGLAIVLYECLLGRKVFTGDVHQVMARIRQGRVPDFSQVLPEGEPALAEFFRCALHRTLARRPASARELRERLVELRENLGREPAR